MTGDTPFASTQAHISFVLLSNAITLCETRRFTSHALAR
jgi:hypothetical protein